MGTGLLVLDAGAERDAPLAELCAARGYRPQVVSTYADFAAAWNLEMGVAVLSLSMASTDGIEAIRFLAERHSMAGLILISDADSRVLSAASRLARARGLRVLGTLARPFSATQFNTVLVHPEPELREATRVLQARLAREELRDCMASGMIQTWFQPKICVRSLNFVAAEALVRLDHPKLGLLRPNAFLAMAEESGLIIELTETVTRDAFAWGALWRSHGIGLQVAVNISPLLLTNQDLPQTLLEWANELALPPESVVLEVTESQLSEDPVSALETLTRLRLNGFQLSIDDFGTGYSTMTQLNEIPYSEMKLDQRFVRNAARDPEARAIVESSIELGHKLGMRVVAEGIEQQTDWDLISELGCDEGQGYFLARPMRPECLGEWLGHWNAALEQDGKVSSTMLRRRSAGT
jgi:EAL domain-containing protein (putative c-di-GMP-specific phosphodiesterase class I)